MNKLSTAILRKAGKFLPLAFNPFSPEYIANPYPTYTRLREKKPVFKTPIGFWLISRHKDVSFVVRDRRFGKDFTQRITQNMGEAYLQEPAIRSLGLMMLVQDPPVHTRLRGLVTKAFTTKRIEALRERIEQLANLLIDEVYDRRRMDVIADFAHKLPVHVICDMLGIPKSHRENFLSRSQVSGRIIDPKPMSAEELAAANQSTQASQEYFQSLFELRRADPGDDLTSHLVQVEEEGDRLSDDELTHNIILLFAAGHETTSNLIGNGLLALFRHPDQLKLMRSNEIDWPDAIEELLRYDSSVQMTSRATKESVELNGVTIPAGEQVIALLGSANRDPKVYDDPDRLDLSRTGTRMMSFGGGIHTCLGARLARLEGEVAFQILMKRLPDLRLEEIDRVDWRDTITLRGLKSLHAVW